MTSANSTNSITVVAESSLSSVTTPPPVEPTSFDRFLNRELSWLAFNQRVLDEANNPQHPLLERLRFLSISASNLDEFYMVRVAGLKAQVAASVAVSSPDNLTPSQQLSAINSHVAELMGSQQIMWLRLREDLRSAGIAVLTSRFVGR
ncbi:hypothetical protein CCP2SC5_1760002 [Azospirillaceae bacterium]